MDYFYFFTGLLFIILTPIIVPFFMFKKRKWYKHFVAMSILSFIMPISVIYASEYLPFINSIHCTINNTYIELTMATVFYYYVMLSLNIGMLVAGTLFWIIKTQPAKTFINTIKTKCPL